LLALPRETRLDSDDEVHRSPPVIHAPINNHSSIWFLATVSSNETKFGPNAKELAGTREKESRGPIKPQKHRIRRRKNPRSLRQRCILVVEQCARNCARRSGIERPATPGAPADGRKTIEIGVANTVSSVTGVVADEERATALEWLVRHWRTLLALVKPECLIHRPLAGQHLDRRVRQIGVDQ
jgi:hypothetical protein